MIAQILPNNNEKCYMNFSPKFFTSKQALTKRTIRFFFSSVPNTHGNSQFPGNTNIHRLFTHTKSTWEKKATKQQWIINVQKSSTCRWPRSAVLISRLKTQLTDWLWEKNTVSAEKTSWKRRIISRINRAVESKFFFKIYIINKLEEQC
jgi:hypothetical protein